MKPNAHWHFVAAQATAPRYEDQPDACQDAYRIKTITDSQAVLVICDGAGSKPQAQAAALFCADKAIEVFEAFCFGQSSVAIGAASWPAVAYGGLRLIRNELEHFATAQQGEISDFACTILISVIYDHNLYFCHVGDGRAAYKLTDGSWYPLMLPYQGENPGATCFLSSQKTFGLESLFRIGTKSLVLEQLEGLCMMTDGCEHLFFETVEEHQKNPRIFSPTNKPHPPALDPAIRMVQQHRDQPEELTNFWQNFLRTDPEARKVNDDKTLILGWCEPTESCSATTTAENS